MSDSRMKLWPSLLCKLLVISSSRQNPRLWIYTTLTDLQWKLHITLSKQSGEGFNEIYLNWKSVWDIFQNYHRLQGWMKGKIYKHILVSGFITKKSSHLGFKTKRVPQAVTKSLSSKTELIITSLTVPHASRFWFWETEIKEINTNTRYTTTFLCIFLRCRIQFLVYKLPATYSHFQLKWAGLGFCLFVFI